MCAYVYIACVYPRVDICAHIHVCMHMAVYMHSMWAHVSVFMDAYVLLIVIFQGRAQSDASGTGGDGRGSSEGRAGRLLLIQAERSPGGEAWQVLPGLLASLRWTFLRYLFHQEFPSQVGWGPVTFSLVFKSQACRLFILWRSRWG